jgi:hypothetical protein
MPDYGQLVKDHLPFSAPFVAPAYPSPPWKLEGCRVLQVSFEISKDVALQALPPALARSYPSYAHAFALECSSSPFGPFAMALQLIVCRWRAFARAHPLHGVIDNPRALVAFRELWGLPLVPGSVVVTASDSAAEVVISGSEPIANFQIAGLEVVTGAEMRHDPIVSTRLVRSARLDEAPKVLELVQVEPKYSYHECWRGQGEVAYGEAAGVWSGVVPRWPIASTVATCDIEIDFARFIESYDDP